MRGAELLQRADVVVHDRLVGGELLRLCRVDAEIVDVGKTPGGTGPTQEHIQRLLVDRARRGLTVVRLKGGDPFVFGRGGEEMIACGKARVKCEVVPGVTSAVAGPAAAGIPVTHRGKARSFAVVTGHDNGQNAECSTDFAALAAMDTVVLLMGRAELGAFARGLIEAGRDPQTPAACVAHATTSRQQVTLATLETVAAAADRDGLEAPVVTVVGWTASMAEAGGAHRPAHPKAAVCPDSTRVPVR